MAIIAHFLDTIGMRVRPVIAGHSTKSVIAIDPGVNIGFIFLTVMKSQLAAHG